MKINPSRVLLLTAVAEQSTAGQHYCYEQSLKGKKIWAERHGYKLAGHTDCKLLNYPPFNSFGGWIKIPLFQQYLNSEEYDFIFWMDADVFITNFETKVDDIVNMSPDSDMWTANDYNGFNSGCTIYRNTEWIKELMVQVLKHGKIKNSPFNDQGSLWYCIENVLKTRDRVYFPPKRVMNSYKDDWQSGDFVCHLVAGRDKEILAKQFLIRHRYLS